MLSKVMVPSSANNRMQLRRRGIYLIDMQHDQGQKIAGRKNIKMVAAGDTVNLRRGEKSSLAPLSCISVPDDFLDLFPYKKAFLKKELWSAEVNLAVVKPLIAC